jgi:hypothetical protein
MDLSVISRSLGATYAGPHAVNGDGRAAGNVRVSAPRNLDAPSPTIRLRQTRYVARRDVLATYLRLSFARPEPGSGSIGSDVRAYFLPPRAHAHAHAHAHAPPIAVARGPCVCVPGAWGGGGGGVRATAMRRGGRGREGARLATSLTLFADLGRAL